MSSELDPTASLALIGRVSDLSLTIGAEGAIHRCTVSSEDIPQALEAEWTGRDWVGTATDESRTRATELRELALARPGSSVRRDVTQRFPDGSEVHIQYAGVATAGGELLLLGRDMRPMLTLRQQLMNAQQALEQDYWRLRQVETRYRLLFQMATEAVLVIDEPSARVLEANPAAVRLLGQAAVGKAFPLGFDARSTEEVSNLLAEARAMGKGSIEGLRTADGAELLSVSATLLRQDGESRVLLRLAQAAAGGALAAPDLADVLRLAPDAVAVTDEEGRVKGVNDAFLELAQLATREQAIGQSVDRWLGRSGVDVSVLLSNLRQRGMVRLFTTGLRGELGAMADVEISASRMDQGAVPAYAFFVRDVGLRVGSEHPLNVKMPKSIEQLTHRVGRVPLKELVRESTDIIEALCIEAALELTSDNRASVAELLGLSRQSLYAKLRRYRIGGLGGEEESAE